MASPFATAPFFGPLLLTLLASSAAQFVQPFLSFSGSISAVSGSTCVSHNSTALNCTTPFQLTLNGTGLSTNVQPRVILANNPYGLSICGPVTVDPMGEWMTCRVVAQGYGGWLPLGNLLSLFLYDLRTGGQVSNAFSGLSLAYIPPPVLQSINGSACQSGGGQAALLCDPSQTVLTFTGQSLGVFVAFGGFPRLCIRDSCGIVTSVSVVNDSVLRVPLSYQYQLFLLAEHYNNTLLPVSLKSGTFSTNALSISFIELPPPSISSIRSRRGSCTPGLNALNQTALLGCSPLADSMYIFGVHMYELQNVSIGGVPMTLTSSYSTSVTAVFPYIPDYVPGRLYDFQMTAGQYSLTLPSAVSFNADPLVTSVSYCIDPGTGYYAQWLQCTPGTRITVNGANLVQQPISVSIFPNNSAYTAGGASVACLDPQVTSSWSLTCTLPQLDDSVAASYQGAINSLVLSYPQNASLAVNLLPVLAGLFQLPNAPYITAIAGCDPFVSQEVLFTATSLIARCVEGSVLTVSGQHFLQYRAPQPLLYSTTPAFTSIVVNASSDSSLTFQLPWLNEYPELTYDTQYLFRVTFNGYLKPSMTQAFYLTLQPYTPPSPQPAGGLSAAGKVVVGVVVPVVVLLVLTVALVLLHRRRHKGGARMVEDGLGRGGGSGGDRAVEMPAVQWTSRGPLGREQRSPLHSQAAAASSDWTEESAG